MQAETPIKYNWPHFPPLSSSEKVCCRNKVGKVFSPSGASGLLIRQLNWASALFFAAHSSHSRSVSFARKMCKRAVTFLGAKYFNMKRKTLAMWKLEHRDKRGLQMPVNVCCLVCRLKPAVEQYVITAKHHKRLCKLKTHTKLCNHFVHQCLCASKVHIVLHHEIAFAISGEYPSIQWTF